MKTTNSLASVKLITLLALLALVAIPATTWAAKDARLWLEGATQGRIPNNVPTDGKTTGIKVVGFGHNVSAPYDAITGIPKNSRQHRPVRIVKDVDKTTPLLSNLMNNNELITSFELRFYGVDGDGADVHMYSVELLNAHVVSIMPSHSSADAESLEIPMRETVSFTYQRIITTWQDGGRSSEDLWNTQSQ